MGWGCCRDGVTSLIILCSARQAEPRSPTWTPLSLSSRDARISIMRQRVFRWMLCRLHVYRLNLRTELLSGCDRTPRRWNRETFFFWPILLHITTRRSTPPYTASHTQEKYVRVDLSSVMVDVASKRYPHATFLEVRKGSKY